MQAVVVAQQSAGCRRRRSWEEDEESDFVDDGSFATETILSIIGTRSNAAPRTYKSPVLFKRRPSKNIFLALIPCFALLIAAQPGQTFSPAFVNTRRKNNNIINNNNIAFFRQTTPIFSSVAASQGPTSRRESAALSPSGQNQYRRKKQQQQHFLAKKRSSKKKYIRQLYKKAQYLERKGQWRKASHILRDIVTTLDPKDAHSHLALARLESRRANNNNNNNNKNGGSIDKASEAFERGTDECPGSVHLWQAWAVHEQARGETEKARELFESALVLDPYNPYVCHAYGLAEYKLENTAKARQLWEQALEKKSTAALVCSLGELLIGNNELVEARDLYAKHVSSVATERERTEIYLAFAWLEERYFLDLDRAQELLQLALRTSPASSVAQVALARLEGRRPMSKQHSTTETVRERLANTCMLLSEKTKQNGTALSADGRVYNTWASLEVKARNLRKARQILDEGLEKYPRDHSLLQAAGKVEERMGNFTGARDLYGTSLRVQPSAPSLVAYALLDLQHPPGGATRNVTKAVRLFEEALLLDPRHGPAYNAYARSVYRYTGDAEAARRVYDRGSTAQCRDAASLYHGYAKLELGLGNVDRARALLLEGQREAQRKDVGKDSPHRERALFLTHTLGMLELNRAHPAEALDVFQDGINRYGNTSQLLLGAALCEVSLGNEEKARSTFKRSVLSDDRHAQAWQAWGVMEMRAGNIQTAKTLFKCGIKNDPKHGALWQAYATMESRFGNVTVARNLFETGVRKAPNHIPLYQSWAFLELKEANFTSAKALISQALTRDKRNGAGWLIAAEIEEQLGNDGLASLLLRRGIECSPTKPELYRALGDSLVRKGKFDEAREIYEQGMKVDPRHAPLYHSLAELEARVFNVEGLSILHKRASAIFNTNALEPPPNSSELLSAKIQANRSRTIPKGVAALAQRIVEEDGRSSSNSNGNGNGSDDHSLDLEDLNPSAFLDEEFVGELLTIDDNRDKTSSL